MASSLASHLCAFLFFFPIGLRRLLSFFSIYLKSSSTGNQFSSKPWYSLHHHSSSSIFIRNLDLYILLIAIPTASFSDLYLFLSILPHRFSFLHHHAIFTFFWLLILLLLLTQYHSPLFPDAFIFLFASTAFLIDYYFIINDGLTSSLISSLAYNLSGGLSLLCAASCVYLSICPYSFVAEFSLSTGLVFKGTWVLQAGLNLYSDAFAFKGCQKIIGQLGDVGVKCDLQEDTMRAIAIISLIFVCHAIGVVVATFALFAYLAAAGLSNRVGDVAGPLLAASQLEPPHSCVQFEIE